MRLVVVPSLGFGETFALVEVNDRTTDSERPGEEFAHRTTLLDD
jgi:hypothetical protein